MKIIDPIGIKIEATQLKDGKGGQWILKCLSRFDEADRDAAENTLKVLNGRRNCKARIVKNSIVYSLTAPRNVVMNVLAFEFLNWSDFSKLTIDEILINMAEMDGIIEDVKWDDERDFGKDLTTEHTENTEKEIRLDFTKIL